MPLRLEPVGYGHPDAVALIEQVQAEYVVRYGSPDESPVEQALFDAPGGRFVVAYDDEVPVAMGGWRRVDLPPDLIADLGTDRVAEIKRMFVVPAAQGRGLARMVLAWLERTAHDEGAEAIVLETGIAQPEAIGLYLSSGYRPFGNYGHYRESPSSRCFAKALTRVGSVNPV